MRGPHGRPGRPGAGAVRDGWTGEEPDDGGTYAADLLDPGTGKVRLLSEQCSTCVGRPGNLMHLREGRLKDLIAQNTGPHCIGLVCHQTLSYGDHPEHGNALCRWFHDIYGPLAGGARVLGRLTGFMEVPPPQEDGHEG